ncbi:MAG: formate dehydrogenase-N subunit alpha [Spirochaetes bacterium]|nr:formate dehydrogenase-N subunit alpha [Spirochaetota bacterium]
MKVTRKNFLKLSGFTTMAAFLGNASLSFLYSCRRAAVNKLKGAEEISSICPMCSMGCGMTVSVKDDKIVNIEGDPVHPINRGKLCSKGSAAFQLSSHNSKRLGRVMYRAPYASDWREISWEEAIKKIAEKIKDAREKTFIEYEGKTTVNRTSGIVVAAGSSLNNEEYYLLSKMARILGITGIYNESEYSHSAAGLALRNTFGYSAMTNHWIDIKNADVILAIGSNPAETHPVSVRFILKAKGKGGKVIHVDPRYTRSSSLADIYAPLRPGTDIAFIGGIINYALQNNRINREYVLEYTNASFIINQEYKFQNGIFNGLKGEKYNYNAWDYEKDRKGIPRADKTLKNSRSVFQIIKNHFSRYTPDIVSRITGCPEDTFLKIANMFTSTGKSGKAGAILFSSGATQHTVGAQNIRAYAILQMLLGNIGIPGGGLNALRQGPNEQGCDDHGMRSDYLPGYLPVPLAEEHSTLDSYIKSVSPLTNNPMSINILSRRNYQIINLLKAYYGAAALKESDYCFHWLPKISKSNYQKNIFSEIQKGIIKGAVFAGANPLMNAPNTGLKAKTMENLEWIAVTGIFETESAAFWKRPNAKPEKIKTEVFFIPSASAFEKDGTLTSSGRWVQWRNKAVNPPEQAKSDLWIIDTIFNELKRLYTEDKNASFPDCITHSNWDYKGEKNDPDPLEVCREINGYDLKTHKQVPEFGRLKDDGSTVAGNWLYCGSYSETGSMTARRSTRDLSSKLGLYPGWAWSWPGNSRILYNRAGVNRLGKPWAQEKQLTEWDDVWEGDAVNGEGMAGPAEKNPFIMLEEGVGKIFAGNMADGPLPEHYEPMESPTGNLLNAAAFNPAIIAAKQNQGGNSRVYPYIATVFRIAEQWQQGVMTKNLSWLDELSPFYLCEISQSLAEAKGIRNGDKVSIHSLRGKLSAYCMVTKRIQPFIINGRKIELIGIVSNSGNATILNCFNNLAHDIGDANSGVPEYKAFLVNMDREA